MKFDNVTTGNAKEYIVKEVAKNTSVAPEIVEKIFSFQFKDVVEATKTNNSIEINGLCRFVVSPNKVKKRILVLRRTIDKCNRLLPDATEKKKLTLSNKIKSAQEALDFLIKKFGYED